ncbi:MAG: hypothetical protein KDB51_13345, partial [Propionibacteriaceae bacterium]|nr:hypothetical protein [Propionibacteriaceae bacterium]
QPGQCCQATTNTSAQTHIASRQRDGQSLWGSGQRTNLKQAKRHPDQTQTNGRSVRPVVVGSPT